MFKGDVKVKNVEKWIKYKIRRKITKTKFRFSSKKEYVRKRYTVSNETLGWLDGFEGKSLNILIVVVDCLRYINTSLSEYERDTTPFLKDFGKSTIGIAAAPWTYPSVPSILSGLYPHNHGAYLRGKFKNFTRLSDLKPVKRSVPLLTDILEHPQLGYKTYVATSIDPVKFALYGRTNMIHYHYMTNGGTILRDFVKWAEQRRNDSFIAYIHIGDTHEPLDPPKKFRSYFGKVEDLPNIDTWNYHFEDERRADPEGFNRYKYNRTLLYDNTIRYVDWALQSLVESLESLRILDDTLMIITADHGEEFWEHADVEARYFKHGKGWSGISHGHNVFREIVEVPLILGGAFEKERLKLTNERSLTDIVPTILDLLGISYPQGYFDGISMKKKRKGRSGILSEGVSSGYEKKALYWGDFKFLYAPMDNVKWVFNLKRDPKEQRPIKDPQITTIFEQKLKKMLSRSVTIRQLGQ